jgi:hypothetical protein
MWGNIWLSGEDERFIVTSLPRQGQGPGKTSCGRRLNNFGFFGPALHWDVREFLAKTFSGRNDARDELQR